MVPNGGRVTTYQILNIVTAIIVFIIGVLISIIGYYIKSQTERVFITIEDFKKSYKEDIKEIFLKIDDDRKDNDKSHGELRKDITENKVNIGVLQSQNIKAEKQLENIENIVKEINLHYISIDRALNANNAAC
jgi:hypothetical protein